MAAFAVMVLPATEARAQLSVLPGFDLWTTAPGTSFMGVPFTGVPLGTFDFGGAVGIQPTGTTDTIIQRLGTATVPGPTLPPAQLAPTIPIEMVALQLMATVPSDFGLGIGTYFITLQSARGGPASPGTMDITFDNTDVPGPPQPPNGTFDSTILVNFDVRLGSLVGPIAMSSSLPLSSIDTVWSHFPDPNQLLINGANNLLNGADHLGDFFPGPLAEIHPGVGVHQVGPSGSLAIGAPEPGSLGLLILGIGSFGARVIRRRL
jgi:hypothetical protein